MWTAIGSFLRDYVLDTLKSIRLTDVLDILLLAVIFWLLWRFIRDRRAVKLMIGLGMIIAVFVVSLALELHALQFVFATFYQVGIIAILIIFQPELRAALEKMGGTPINGIRGIAGEGHDLAGTSAAIETIAHAANELSREKVGALIVIERTTRLGDYMKSGVEIDAEISDSLLRNLFFNKAPLHDGAVIIRDNRVAAAGCFLPLTQRADVDLDLGTRHRAAIGVTEVSDAVVVVVSEENGTISVCSGGNIERNFHYTTLKQKLNGMLLMSQANQNPAKKSESEEEETHA